MASVALPDLTARIRVDDSELDKAEKTAGRFGGALKGAAVAGAAVAGAALLKFGRDSVTAFTDSEQSSLRLDEALKKFPKTADVSRAQLDKLNESLAAKTRFDDDATASGQAVLAQFQLTGAQITELTPLLQDYAARTGKSLPDAALDLGKAIQGQGRALKAVGLDLQDTGSQTGNLDALTKGLRAQVGGFAEAEGKTAAGAAEILGNRFGEVQEKVGAKLVPALTSLANGLIAVIGFVERNSEVVVPLVAILGGLALGITAVNAAATAYTAVQSALNVVLALNPIGLVVLALAALVAGIVIAYKNSETFRDIVNTALEAVKTAFTTLATAALGVIDSILAGYQALASAAGKLPGPLGAPFRAAAEAIGVARQGVQGLTDKINAVPKSKTADVKANVKGTDDVQSMRRAIDSVKSKTVFLTTVLKTENQRDATKARNNAVPGRATGGPVRAGMPYVVGEREAELFVPRVSGRILNQKQIAAAAGGGGAVYNVTINRYGGNGDGRDVVSALQRWELLSA